MSRPDALTTLLEDLQTENPGYPVAQHDQSSATVYLSDGEVVLRAQECNLVFQNSERVQQFYEALGCPEDAAVEFVDLIVEPEVLNALEQLFTAVDER